MKYGIREVDTKKTKILKIITGIVGGMVCAATLVLGIISATSMSLPVIGGLLLCGLLPAEAIITCSAVKNTLVETLEEESIEEFYIENNKLIRSTFCAIGDEIVEGPHEEVMAERVNGRWIYLNPEMNEVKNRTVNSIKFTPIKPMDRSLEDSKNMVRQRVIEFKPKNSKEK